MVKYVQVTDRQSEILSRVVSYYNAEGLEGTPFEVESHNITVTITNSRITVEWMQYKIEEHIDDFHKQKYWAILCDCGQQLLKEDEHLCHMCNILATRGTCILCNGADERGVFMRVEGGPHFDYQEVMCHLNCYSMARSLGTPKEYDDMVFAKLL